jgi:hypothetical protein
MAKNVQLTVDIKGGDSVGKAAEKTKTLRQELIKLKDELARGELSGGEFVKAQQRAAELQKTIEDVNKSTKSLSSNNLDAFLDLGSGIAGGFAAAQGAMALFGDENDDLQKKLVKVQSAVAILNGLQAVQKVLAKEGAIVTKITNFLEAQRAAAISTTSVALQGAAVKARMFGAALAATGIGLAIVAVGILAEKFGLFGDSVDETTQKLKESRDRLNEYAEQVAELDALSISRKKRETDLAKARLKLNGATNDELIEQDKRLLEFQKVFFEMQVKDRAKGSDEQLKAIDKLEDIKTQIALKDIERQTEIQNRAKKEQEKIDALNKKALDKKQKEDEKKLAQAKKDAEDLQKIVDEATIVKQEKDFTDQAKEIAELGRVTEAKIKVAKDDAKAIKIIEDASLIELQAIKDKYAKEDAEKLKEKNKVLADLIEQRRVDDLSVREKELFDIQDKYAKEAELAKGHADLLAEIETDKNNALALKKKEFAQQDADFQKEVDNVRLDSMIATANQASQLLSAVAGKNKSVAMAALAVEKGAAIADVIIKGIRERSGINAKYSLIPGGQALAVPELIASRIRTGLSVATIAATGIQGAKSIGNSGGSGGGSVQPPNIRGSQTTNEPTSQPATKVFVTETDIRSSLRKVDGIYTQSTIQ